MNKYETSQLISNLFLRSGQAIRTQKGDIVLGWEQDPAGVYYVEHGYVKAYSITPDGNENIHLIYGPREIFPLIWALLHVKQQVYYEVLSETILLRLPVERFNEFSHSSNLASRAIMRQIAYQYYVYTDRVDNLEYKKPAQRVAYRLLFLAGRFGAKSDSGIFLNGPFTHQLIADSINLARETVSREMEHMEHDDLITRLEHRIVIKNIAGLKDMLGGDLRVTYWGLD